MTLSEEFLLNFPPDENGWTPIIKLDELLAINPNFKSNNGCQWARKGSKLDNTYNLKRFQAKDMGGKGNRVVAFQLQGFKEKAENHSIPIEVRRALKGRPCVVLGVVTSDMEIDHKNGRYDSESYTINDFQPMSKAANDAKREQCKRCISSNCRFDAKTLGYTISFIEGDFNTSTCPGCFWYDPVAFRQALVKGENDV